MIKLNNTVNALSKLIINAMKTNPSFSIFLNDEIVNGSILIEKVNYYLSWINSLSVNSVMLVSNPSINSICLMYALVLSNKTYIPIHASASLFLIKAHLKSTQVDLLLICPELAPTIDTASDCFLSYESGIDFFLHVNQAEKKSNLVPGICFFTSGSTGLPKCVHFNYKTIADYLSFCVSEFNPTEEDTFLFSTQLSFVACLRPLFIPFFVGANLVIMPTNKKHDPSHTLHLIKKHSVSIITFLPTFFNFFVHFISNEKEAVSLYSIRQVFLGGGVISSDEINHWFSNINETTVIYNLYGATEYFMPFYKKITQILSIKESKHLGILRDKSSYLLVENDKDSHHLFIAGSLATAYLDSSLTKKHFITYQGVKYFKTNDLVKIENEALYFFARNSRIIKRQGNTINLDNIENIYNTHISKNTVAVFFNNENQLCMIIEALNESEINKTKNKLKKYLANYMIPSHISTVKKIAKTSSGKINYEGLNTLNYDFFARYFIDGVVIKDTYIAALGLESIDFIELSEHIFKSTGKQLDISSLNDDIKISDIELIISKKQRLKLKDKSDDFVKLNHIKKFKYKKQLKRKEGATSACIIATYCLTPKTDIKKLKSAVINTIKNNFMLSVRLVKKGAEYVFVRTDIDTNFSTNRSLLSKVLGIKKLNYHVDLLGENLVKFFFEKRGIDKYLIISYHQIALDGWSMMKLREEIFLRYENRTKPIKADFKKEISNLNTLSKIYKDPNLDIEPLLKVYSNIQLKIHREIDFIFNDYQHIEQSSLIIPKERVNQYMTNNECQTASFSSIFLLFIYLMLEKVSNKNQFYIKVNLSNRLSAIPFSKDIMLSLETVIPLLFSKNNRDTKTFVMDINKKLNVIFKYMSYQTLFKLYKDPLIAPSLVQNEKLNYDISFTYMSKTKDESLVQDKYINWFKSKSELAQSSKGLIFFSVHDMGEHFVINLNTQVSEGIHQKLLVAFKESVFNAERIIASSN